MEKLKNDSTFPITDTEHDQVQKHNGHIDGIIAVPLQGDDKRSISLVSSRQPFILSTSSTRGKLGKKVLLPLGNTIIIDSHTQKPNLGRRKEHNVIYHLGYMQMRRGSEPTIPRCHSMILLHFWAGDCITVGVWGNRWEGCDEER